MIYPYILMGVGVLNLVALGLVWMRLRNPAGADIEKTIREEMRQEREGSDRRAREMREELAQSQGRAHEQLVNTVNTLGVNQKGQLADLVKETKAGSETVQKHTELVKADLTKQREQIKDQLINIHKENEARFGAVRDTLDKRLKEMAEEQQKHLANVVKVQQEEQEKVRSSLEQRFRQIQESNEKKLDEMRRIVDEKLHDTLEKRLGHSFKRVGEQLEAVQRGLGEMKSLATGVDNLQRVLVNVKERGTWGEYQLGNILADILTPEQYAQNVAITDGRETVEFAVKLPGRESDHAQPVWLPIDAKFPRESYERLVDASVNADAGGVKTAAAELQRAVERMAKDIKEKYIHPPASTDFAILFLPTEGLFAEVLRQPGLQNRLQQHYRVLVAGPTTLSAILNSLRVGFQTLAIEKRTSEVWQILGAVKTEFGKFGNVLEKIKKQVNTVSNTLDESAQRTRVMERKLRAVEEIPADQTATVLGADFTSLAHEDAAAEPVDDLID